MPEEIDVQRAEAAKKRSESQIEKAKREHNQDDLARAEVHLKRAINRLNTSKLNKK